MTNESDLLKGMLGISTSGGSGGGGGIDLSGGASKPKQAAPAAGSKQGSSVKNPKASITQARSTGAAGAKKDGAKKDAAKKDGAKKASITQTRTAVAGGVKKEGAKKVVAKKKGTITQEASKTSNAKPAKNSPKKKQQPKPNAAAAANGSKQKSSKSSSNSKPSSNSNNFAGSAWEIAPEAGDLPTEFDFGEEEVIEAENNGGGGLDLGAVAIGGAVASGGGGGVVTKKGELEQMGGADKADKADKADNPPPPPPPQQTQQQPSQQQPSQQQQHPMQQQPPVPQYSTTTITVAIPPNLPPTRVMAVPTPAGFPIPVQVPLNFTTGMLMPVVVPVPIGFGNVSGGLGNNGAMMAQHQQRDPAAGGSNANGSNANGSSTITNDTNNNQQKSFGGEVAYSGIANKHSGYIRHDGPPPQFLNQKRRPQERVSSLRRNLAPSGSARRPGDWDCTKCRAHNYANRMECFKCKEKKAGGKGENPPTSGEAVNKGAAARVR